MSPGYGLRMAATLCLCAGAGSALAAQCGEVGVAVQVLGSGGPEVQGKRAASSYLVWQDGRARVLIDAGGGAAVRFGESGATVSGLDAVLFTHLHADHSADFPALIKSSVFENRERALPVFGPAGSAYFPATTAFVRAMFDRKGGAFRYLADFADPKGGGSYTIQAHDVALKATEVRVIHSGAGLRVEAAPVVHGPVPALAYRVQVGEKSAVFSGDTNGDNGNLEKLARSADIFVAHNAVPEGAGGVERFLHMPPSVIGRIARDANVGRLVLSHRMLRTLGKESQSQAAIAESYSGPVSFADDLNCYPLR